MNAIVVSFAAVTKTERCMSGFLGMERLGRILKEAGEIHNDEKLIEVTITDKGIRFVVEKTDDPTKR